MKSIFIFGLLIISSLGYVKSQAPYCSAAHSISCSSHNMHIGAVRIEEHSTIIFNKANDGCNQTSAPNYTLMSTSPSFTLIEGGAYQMSFSTGNTYNVKVGVWIDLNRDNDFADTGEYLSTGWADIAAGGTLQPRYFFLPCGIVSAGTTRMRIRTDSAGSSTLNSVASCTTIKYGETEDYTLNLNTAIKPIAGFSMPDTIYVGVPIKFISNNRLGYLGFQWDMDDNGSIEYTTIDALHYFTHPGRYCIRLKSWNCFGITDYTNCFNVLTPSLKINAFKKDETLNLYPNPSTGIIYLSDNISISEIKIFNSLGMLVKDIHLNRLKNGIETIDLSNEPKGLYTIKFKANSTQRVQKISILN